MCVIKDVKLVNACMDWWQCTIHLIWSSFEKLFQARPVRRSKLVELRWQCFNSQMPFLVVPTDSKHLRLTPTCCRAKISKKHHNGCINQTCAMLYSQSEQPNSMTSQPCFADFIAAGFSLLVFTRDSCTGRYCWERVLAMGILSVCLSVRLSRPGGIPRAGEIETPGLHHMIA